MPTVLSIGECSTSNARFIVGDPIGDHVIAQIVDELLTNGERATGELHLGDTRCGGDLVERGCEHTRDVLGAGRRTDRRHGTHLGNRAGNRKHR